MVAVIKYWEWHITTARPDIAPDVSEEELAQFRNRVSNSDNVREFMEQWAGEDRVDWPRSGPVPDRSLFWRP
jgi:hypothetical protein